MRGHCFNHELDLLTVVWGRLDLILGVSKSNAELKL